MVELSKLKVKNARFLTVPKRRKIAGLKQFVFDTGGKIEVLILGEKLKVGVMKIPKGFICDSTSLPWAVDSAGDVHDFGYCVQGSKKGYTKEFWDDVFYYLMLDIGMPKWRAKVRYWGVKYLGGRAYRQRRAEKYQALRMEAVANLIKELGV